MNLIAAFVIAAIDVIFRIPPIVGIWRHSISLEVWTQKLNPLVKLKNFFVIYYDYKYAIE